MSPGQLPRICSQDASIETGLKRSREEGDGEFVVVGHVELVEAQALTVGFADFLDRAGAGSGETVGEVQLFGDGGDG